MRLHYLQHVPFEGLGSIATWANTRGHTVAATHLYAGDSLPDPGGLDWLIIMGGPMGVHDEADHPWLVDEKRLIARTIDSGKRVLGICLGAQLIAAALGARVYPNPEREIGWLPIRVTAAAARSAVGRILGNPVGAGASVAEAGRVVFHWHGDTFDLPPGAVHLARSAACEHQAFSIDDRVVGLQFHLETTHESAAALIRHCAADLRPGAYVQQAPTILSDAARFAAINALMEKLLDTCLAGA